MNKMFVRSESEDSRQERAASCATRSASSTKVASGTGTIDVTSPVAGLCTGN